MSFGLFFLNVLVVIKKQKVKMSKRKISMDIGGVINHIKTKILPEIMTFRQWSHLRLVKI